MVPGITCRKEHMTDHYRLRNEAEILDTLASAVVNVANYGDKLVAECAATAILTRAHNIAHELVGDVTDTDVVDSDVEDYDPLDDADLGPDAYEEPDFVDGVETNELVLVQDIFTYFVNTVADHSWKYSLADQWPAFRKTYVRWLKKHPEFHFPIDNQRRQLIAWNIWNRTLIADLMEKGTA